MLRNDKYLERGCRCEVPRITIVNGNGGVGKFVPLDPVTDITWVWYFTTGIAAIAIAIATGVCRLLPFFDRTRLVSHISRRKWQVKQNVFIFLIAIYSHVENDRASSSSKQIYSTYFFSRSQLPAAAYSSFTGYFFCLTKCLFRCE